MTHPATSSDAGSDALAGPRSLVGLGIVYFLNFASLGIQLPFTALAMQDAGSGPVVVGAMWGARSLTGAITPVFWGLLADRLGGARPLVIGAFVCGAAILMGLSTAPGPAMAIGLFALFGIFANPANSLVDGMTLLALGPRAHRFGRMRAIGTVGFGVGTLTASILIERAILPGSAGALFPLCAGLTLSAGLVVAVVVPSIPRPGLTRFADVTRALRQPVLFWLIAAGSLLWASHAGYVSFLSPLTALAGLPPSAVGLAVGAAVTVETIAMFAAPAIVRRIGAPATMIVCAVVAVLRWLLTPACDTPLSYAAINSLHGISFGLFFVVIVAEVARRVPDALRQASQGLLSSLSLGVGGVVGGLFVGTLLERGGDGHGVLVTVYGAMAAVALASLVVMVPLRKRLRSG